MKKATILAFALTVIIAVAALTAAAANVVVTPSVPTDSNDLACFLSNNERGNFYWFKNGVQMKEDLAVLRSTIPAEATKPDEKWTCKAYDLWDSFIGSASVTIRSETGGKVTIIPEVPVDTDDLKCYVAGEKGRFNFYWYSGETQIFSDLASTESILDESKTSPGQTIRCRAYDVWDSYIGEASVKIFGTSSESGNVIILPPNPYTNDDLFGFVNNSAYTKFNYYWTKNGFNFKREFNVINTTISAAETKKHEIWTLTAEADGISIGSASVEILNSAPIIIRVDAPSAVYEGDPIEISFSATDADNDALAYTIYRNGQNVANSSTFIWNTKAGDKGTYTFVLAVNDGEVQTSIPIQIVVKRKTDTEDNKTKTIRLIKDLEVTPFSKYLMIRNNGRSIKGLKLSLTFLNNGAEEHAKIDISRSEVKYLPISTKLEEGKVYAAKIKAEAYGSDDYGYLIIRK